MEWIFHIGIAQSLFSAFLLFTRKSNTLSDRILAFWMLFICLELCHMLLEITDSPLHGYTSNFGFYSLTFGPFLFLYIKKLTREYPRLELRDLVHFAPYIILSLLHLIFYTNRPLLASTVQQEMGWFILNMVRLVVLLFSLAAYSFASLRLLEQHKRNTLLSFSDNSTKVTLSWLRYMILIFVSTYLILLLNFLTGNFTQSFVETSHFIPAFGLTLFCYSLSYYGYKQQEIFRIFTQKLSETEGLQILTEERKSILQAQLLTFMTKEQPFLKSEISIQELADEMKLPRHYLTEILRTGLQKNFFSFINEYRIQAVKDELQKDSESKRSVLDIAYSCGF